jgi:hypothetical protein
MGRMKQVKRIRLFIVISFIVLSGTAFIPRMSFAEKDSDKSFGEYSSLAKQGDAEAQLHLGNMYRKGKDVPKDYQEAVWWYRKAAEQGEAKAQLHLGDMYMDGEGVPQNYKEAVRWYRKAAEQGDAVAQLHLGVMYNEGKGVAVNRVLSYAWLNISAAQGVEKASKFRDKVATALYKSGIALNKNLVAKAQEISMEYYKKYVEPFQ